MFAFTLTLFSNAQKTNYYRNEYGLRDGLPTTDIRWVTRDRLGFLWIGTWDGLVRYDGAEFKVYKHNPNDSTSLAYFEVPMICVDSLNQVWTISSGKICRYNRNSDSFISYDESDFVGLHGIRISGPINSIFLDNRGSVISGRGKFLYKYSYPRNVFEKIHWDTTEIDFSHLQSTSFDRNGDLWTININSDTDFGQVRRYRYKTSDTLQLINEYSLQQDLLRDFPLNFTFHVKVITEPSDTIWFACNNGLYRLEGDTFRIFKGEIPPRSFSDQSVVLWAQEGLGLMVYYPEIFYQDTLLTCEDDQIVGTYYADDDQNIWYSRRSDNQSGFGLGLIYKTPEYFKHFLNEYDSSIPVAVFGLIKDDMGNIWAGGRPNDHLVRIFPDGAVKSIKMPLSSMGYYHFARDMALDDKGNIWIGFFSDFLYRLDPINEELQDFSNSGYLKNGTQVLPRYRIVKKLRTGELFTGGGGVLHVFDPESTKGYSSSTPLFQDFYSCYDDVSGALWIGLSGQLMKTNLKLEGQEFFQISEVRYNIEDICPGDSTDLWLALLGGGIAHFFPEKQSSEFYTTYDGLAHNTVYNLEKDRNGNLWLSHDLGISMLNPGTGNIVNYNEKDGLHIREFNSEAAFQTVDGEIIFGGMGGIVSFYPNTIERVREESASPLLLTDLKVSSGIQSFSFPSNKDGYLPLPKGTDNFQLTLIKPDLRNGVDILYRYKLQGGHRDWIYTDSRHRKVNYTSLKPGKYLFLADATDQTGEWRYHTSLRIIIPPFYYQSWWFKLLLVFISLFVIFMFFIMKIRQMRLTERKKYEQLKLETLRGQMNPHFIYNSLNSINYFISLNDQYNANQYISDFSRLMRSIMTNSSQEFVALEAEIQTLKDYLALEHLRFSDKFEYEFCIDDRIDQITTEVIPSLIQPFVENAIWHGLRYLESRKGFLSIRFLVEGESLLICMVEDDGIGRKLSVKLKTTEQKKRRSRGIAMVEERLKLINSFFKTNYSITIFNLHDDREETGTQVRIELPVRK